MLDEKYKKILIPFYPILIEFLLFHCDNILMQSPKVALASLAMNVLQNCKTAQK